MVVRSGSFQTLRTVTGSARSRLIDETSSGAVAVDVPVTPGGQSTTRLAAALDGTGRLVPVMCRSRLEANARRADARDT